MNFARKRKKKKEQRYVPYALSGISAGYPGMVSLRRKPNETGSRIGNAPEQIESESEDHSARKIKSRRAGIRPPATRVLNSKARVIHSVGLPLAVPAGDTAFMTPP